MAMFLELQAGVIWIPQLTDHPGFRVEVETEIGKLAFSLAWEEEDREEFCRCGQAVVSYRDIASGVFFPAKLEILFKAEGQESFGHSGIVVRFPEREQSLSIFRDLMDRCLWNVPHFRVL